MKPTTTLSTADVPPRFLKAALAVGRTPFKTLATEPRVSYTLYIPESHYNPNPSLKKLKDAATLHSAYLLPKLPLVVTVHGTGRNAEQCRDSLISLAESMHVAILAPLFPAGASGLESLDNYKILRDDTLHADSALIDILNEIKQCWLGVATENVSMIGFSGGGQFVHRFMYLYPSRLNAVSIGAPGQVTELDDQPNWPAGIKDVADRFNGAAVELDMIRELPIQLIGGALDTETYGGDEFWEWLQGMKNKQSSAVDTMTKVTNRKVTLERLRDNWQTRGIQCQLDIVNDAGHKREKVLEAVVMFLQPHIKATSQKLANGV